MYSTYLACTRGSMLEKLHPQQFFSGFLFFHPVPLQTVASEEESTSVQRTPTKRKPEYNFPLYPIICLPSHSIRQHYCTALPHPSRIYGTYSFFARIRQCSAIWPPEWPPRFGDTDQHMDIQSHDSLLADTCILLPPGIGLGVIRGSECLGMRGCARDFVDLQ